MERTKRRRDDSSCDNNDDKRMMTTNDSNRQYRTYFEDIPNEILYEIFEFLDIYHIYVGFFNLNQRFQNLLTASPLLIKINLSSISKSTFEDYYKHIIMSNKRRISSLYLSIQFTMILIFTRIRIVSN